LEIALCRRCTCILFGNQNKELCEKKPTRLIIHLRTRVQSGPKTRIQVFGTQACSSHHTVPFLLALCSEKFCSWACLGKTASHVFRCFIFMTSSHCEVQGQCLCCVPFFFQVTSWVLFEETQLSLNIQNIRFLKKKRALGTGLLI
jgi:hypothetical protein